MSAMVVALEKFKSILPECVATYVAEKQATDESAAAVLVDELIYSQTHKAQMRSSHAHKVDFSSNRSENVGAHQASGVDRSSTRSDADQGCRYWSFKVELSSAES